MQTRRQLDWSGYRDYEYINPHLLGEILSALYSTCSLDGMSLQDQAKLDKFVDDMWGA